MYAVSIPSVLVMVEPRGNRNVRCRLQVRTRLAAGGNWIRTSGSARQVDVGTVVNPIGLKGQIHGGVVQGLGQALVSSRLAG